VEWPADAGQADPRTAARSIQRWWGFEQQTM